MSSCPEEQLSTRDAASGWISPQPLAICKMAFVVLLTVPLEAGAWCTHAGPLTLGPVPASVISCDFDDVPALLEGTV